MSKKKICRGIVKLLVWTFVIGIVWLGVGVGGIKAKCNDIGENNRIRAVENKIYNDRFPKAGDMVELNGQKITILKLYVWARRRTYRARMPNGTITDVVGSELIDKEIIKIIPDN